MRQSGILLPLFSLWGDYGIGSLGAAAREFIDFLHGVGQSYWQLLPINPTAYLDSPYQSPCSFAGNPYFIDLDDLRECGLITPEEQASQRHKNTERIDYGLLYRERLPLLSRAAERLTPDRKDMEKFKEDNAFWLESYCMFMAYKERSGMKPLPFTKYTAPPPDRDLLKSAETHMKIQFLFYRQWERLKAYAEHRGIRLIGDIPIYAARDSSDCFARPEMFMKDFVAGCPPDSFAEKGQLWGNPIYDWDSQQELCFSFWRERLGQASRLFDALRIDHFRGIYEFYAIPEGSTDATEGRWMKGPGLSLCSMIHESFPDLEIIAEDLGFITKDAREFFCRSGFDTMKVLQFAFDGSDSEHLPHNHTVSSLCYTGTHDNPTLLSWLCAADKDELSCAMDYLGCRISQLRERMISAAMGSVCRLTVIPLQDYMGLGCIGRINTPGEGEGNWRFRLRREDMTDRLKEDIMYYTKTYHRLRQEETI